MCVFLNKNKIIYSKQFDKEPLYLCRYYINQVTLITSCGIVIFKLFSRTSNNMYVFITIETNILLGHITEI